MSTRQDFTLKYLVALYKVHRLDRDALASISSLKAQFILPEDPYLESELCEMLEHRSWAQIGRNNMPFSDWILRITMLGKEAAESQIEQGLEVLPFAEFIDETSAPDPTENAPAADRMVSFGDNAPEFESVRDSLAELTEHLSNANDVGDMTDAEVEEARREVWLLEQAFNTERVRVDWIESIAVKCLKWIIDKSAGAAVGEAAKATLSVILSLLSRN